MSKLKGKVAVVTGGNSGIGLASAKAFVNEGASVIIVARRRDAADAAIAQIGSNATALVGDVADLSTHDRLADLVRERFGAVDIYMANAGTATLEPSSAVDPVTYDQQFAVNTRGVFFGVTKLLPLMRDGGAILLTSSIATTKVMENHAVYAGTKAAIEAFARSWAIELKQRRIRVNVLSPGSIDTAAFDGVAQEVRDGFISIIPLGRLGRPEEIATAALFLASDDSSFVTGIELFVDGGTAQV